jgi:hypothetical protein
VHRQQRHLLLLEEQGHEDFVLAGLQIERPGAGLSHGRRRDALNGVELDVRAHFFLRGFGGFSTS